MNNNKKIVLFDGKNFDLWHRRDGSKAIDWTIDKDGIATVGTGDIITDEIFGDAMLHVEFRTPYMPEAEGQGKGNSGVFINGCYEVQVLDSSDRKNPDECDCGAVYGMYEPQMNACKPALEWQTYDIMFRAPRYDDKGEITEYARLTVLLNGLAVQNNVVLPRVTPGGIEDEIVKEGHLLLQDHCHPVSYRNIWLIHLS